MPEQMDFFASYAEIGPRDWNPPPKAAPIRLDEPQLPLVTTSGLIPDPSGGFARSITQHSLKKQDRVYRYADTVSVAMARKWSIWWLDLFAGPGAVFERGESRFYPAIPAKVCNDLRCRLDGYVFNDLNPECVDSLERRLDSMPGLTIACGDANDLEHLESLVSAIPRSALVLAYLDPEGLDLHLETIRWLAWRFRHLDLLLNLPVQAIDRSISAGALDPVRRVLGHAQPQALLGGTSTGQKIRNWFRLQLGEMGYPAGLCVGEEIRSEQGVPQYDLMLASRTLTAIELYRRANESDSSGQKSFGLAC